MREGPVPIIVSWATIEAWARALASRAEKERMKLYTIHGTNQPAAVEEAATTFELILSAETDEQAVERATVLRSGMGYAIVSIESMVTQPHPSELAA